MISDGGKYYEKQASNGSGQGRPLRDNIWVGAAHAKACPVWEQMEGGEAERGRRWVREVDSGQII